MTTQTENKSEKMHFQADVSKLLHIVTHSLYSEKEIFLRELLSNASDACDRLKYRALTDDHLRAVAHDFRVVLYVDKDNKTLTIADNGMGMSRDDMIENLGTIARSGTERFLQELEQAGEKDKSNAIGKFGVGFYSSFIVSDKVVVISRAAGQDKAYRWESNGIGEFEIVEAGRDIQGTSITLYLKQDCEEFLEGVRLEYIVKTYSNYLPVPVLLTEDKEFESHFITCEGKQLNEAIALWLKNKKDVTENQYKEFYHHVAHAYDDPLSTLHFNVEGALNYRGLLFIPGQRPFDLFHADRMSKVKLYNNRVFITDECEELIPRYLRFLRGVVDCEDLSLNVSREMLQNNAMIAKIRTDITKRVFKDVQKIAKEDVEKFLQFWDMFGLVLKEGLCDPMSDKEILLGISRFYSNQKIEELTTLEDYVSRMKDGQKCIYYLAGDQKESLLKSPQLEVFKRHNIEVLFMLDPVDEFWLPTVGKFKDLEFKSITAHDVSLQDILDKLPEEEKEKKNDVDEALQSSFIDRVKDILKDHVADVRYSERLVDSAVCLVSPEGALDMHMERLLKEHNRLDQVSKKVLELNKQHSVIASLMKQEAHVSEGDIMLLFEQACILEGDMPKDRASFIARIQELMIR